jgi:hypothetical protein
MKPPSRNATRDPARHDAAPQKLIPGDDPVLSGRDPSQRAVRGGFLPHTGKNPP